MIDGKSVILNFWTCMGEIKSVGDHSKLRFGFMVKLANRVLVSPHSNADPERFLP